MVVDQNSFFQEWTFLAKKTTFAKLSPCLEKTFAGPCWIVRGNFWYKTAVWQGILSVWATKKIHASQWSLLTFSGQFWHFHTETNWKQDITSQHSREAVFRQALSKLLPNFRGIIAVYKLHLQKSVYVPVMSYYFREACANKKHFTIADSGFTFRQRSFWHTKLHRILNSKQGPFDRHSYVYIHIYIYICVLHKCQITIITVCRSVVLYQCGKDN